MNVVRSLLGRLVGDSSYVYPGMEDFDASIYPDHIWLAVFARCDYATLKRLKLTCRSFYALLADQHFWLELCERDGRMLPPMPCRQFIAQLPEEEEDDDEQTADMFFDYEMIWRKDPFRANLVPALTADMSLKDIERNFGWKFSSAANGPVLESPPVSCELRADIPVAIATSFSWNRRMLTVNLVQEGVPEWVLDRLRPRIVVREWVAPRTDCASVYELHAQLLKADELLDSRAVLPRFKFVEKRYPQWTAGEWELVEVVFEEYPVGMRCVSLLSSGKDSQFWAGNYGTKFANTQVFVELPTEPKLYSDADFPDGVKTYGDGSIPYIGLLGGSLRMPIGRHAGIRGRIHRL